MTTLATPPIRSFDAPSCSTPCSTPRPATQRPTPLRRVARLHRCLGLVAAPVLAVVGLTGALLAVEPVAITLAAPRIATTAPAAPRLSLDSIVARVARSHHAPVALLELPRHARAALVVAVGRAPNLVRVHVDPATGAEIGGSPRLDAFFRDVAMLHRRLLAGAAGQGVVVLCTVCVPLLAIGALAVRPRKHPALGTTHGWRRTRLLHDRLGGSTWAVLVVLALSGLAVHWDVPLQRVLGRLTHARASAPPSDLATTCGTARPLPLERLLAAARAAMPGARPTIVILPAAPDAPLRVSLRRKSDHTPAGRSMVLLDPCSARVLWRQDTRTAPLSFTLPRVWARTIHTGDALGWPTQALAGAGALAMTLLALSGPAAWWARRDARRRAP